MLPKTGRHLPCCMAGETCCCIWKLLPCRCRGLSPTCCPNIWPAPTRRREEQEGSTTFVAKTPCSHRPLPEDHYFDVPVHRPDPCLGLLLEACGNSCREDSRGLVAVLPIAEAKPLCRCCWSPSLPACRRLSCCHHQLREEPGRCLPLL